MRFKVYYNILVENIANDAVCIALERHLRNLASFFHYQNDSHSTSLQQSPSISQRTAPSPFSILLAQRFHMQNKPLQITSTPHISEQFITSQFYIQSHLAIKILYQHIKICMNEQCKVESQCKVELLEERNLQFVLKRAPRVIEESANYKLPREEKLILARDARDLVSMAFQRDNNTACREFVLVRTREEVELCSVTSLSLADKIYLGDRIRSPDPVSASVQNCTVQAESSEQDGATNDGEGKSKQKRLIGRYQRSTSSGIEYMEGARRLRCITC